MKRKTFLPQAASVPGIVFLEKYVLQLFNQDSQVLRATQAPRKCTGQLLVQATSDFIFRVANKEMRWLFEGCRRCPRETPALRLFLYPTVEKFRITNLICFFP